MSDPSHRERLDRFMARANAAYYAGRDPFADFITAPEIAQVFGELIGAWAVVMWQLMGRPDPVLLCEAGPGRGTLMADALRLVRRVAPDFATAVRLHLVETSPRLRAIQADALAPFLAPSSALSSAGIRPCWHDAIDTIPPGPILLIGNEFLDALPIRQIELSASGWQERFVQDCAFILLATDLPAPAGSFVVGAVAERCEPAEAIVDALSRRIVRDGGAVLLLDYGPDRPGIGDTLQALRDGRPAPPLDAPGEADLTAHVDFPALAAVARARGVAVHGPEGQGAFLSALGLFQRTGRLASGRSPEEARALVDAAHRLAAPERMGRLFKVMALCHPSLGVPPGFPGGG